MFYQKTLNALDLELSKQLDGFVPDEIFDIHTHPYNASHFAKGDWAFLDGIETLGCQDHQLRLQSYMPSKTIHGLYFGMPRKSADRLAMNNWVGAEVERSGTALSRYLLVVAPDDDPKEIAAALKSPLCCGIKVYHCYANRKDTMQAELEEYAPEWMWELLHEHKGVMLLHIVKDGGIEDPGNQKQVKRLCKAYPGVKLILAHIARSFNYRNARSGLYTMADLDNVVVDTSAIAESEAFTAAIKALGPQRILWGSDFGVSEMRGRCITTANRFFWLHPELINKDYAAPTQSSMTLIGIESLLTLKESCEEAGLNRSDTEDIFLNNALRLLQPHLQPQIHSPEVSGPELWINAKKLVSGGTGLLSKRAEQFSENWPSYFSRSSGSLVWDLNGKKYIDCAGGIGAVLLGYADRDVTAAINRRLTLGTYSSLVNPQELELAEKLLALHPWAGKTRYARTGGEAMAIAVRIARAASGKSGVAFCGYHGWHDWYLAANLGEGTALDGHLLPGLQPKGVPRALAGTAVPFNYNNWPSFEAAVEKLADNFGVVVMEPMRSRFPEDNFLQKIRALCTRKNAVLVIDEITSGLRFGYPGALSRYDITPDIVAYAKAMGNGVPFAAIVGKEEVMAAADDSFISSSYWTDGIGTAAALSVLQKIETENVSQAVWHKGELLQQQLKAIAAKYPDCNMQVGGMPASPTFSFVGNHAKAAKKLLVNNMLRRDILVGGIFYLMHAHTTEQLSLFVECFEESLQIVNDQLQKGSMAKDTGTGFQQGFTRLA